jgi:hypothetical protein
MDAKIQQQHAQRENVEENPEIEQCEFLAASIGIVDFLNC